MCGNQTLILILCKRVKSLRVVCYETFYLSMPIAEVPLHKSRLSSGVYALDGDSLCGTSRNFLSFLKTSYSVYTTAGGANRSTAQSQLVDRA